MMNGYDMSSAGWVVMLSMVVAILALVVAVLVLSRRRARP
jgi:hypothetical protein